VFVSYVELHSHSAFSFLDGTSQPEELVAAAIERGHTALALTDHDTVSGSMEFAQAARGVGLRAIHGAEVTLSDGRHVTLLVRDTTGWANLSRLLTRAHAHTRDHPSRRILGTPAVGLDDLEEVARRIAEGRFTNRAECTLEVSTYVWNRNSFEAQHHFEDACTDHGIRFAVVERVGGIEWSCPKAAGT